jgi:CheY-like chemotaxis protein
MEVLLCEDSPGDVRLTKEAFRIANEAVNLHVATDGLEALVFLRKNDMHIRPRPDLILLDLNMPKMDGREVLAHIKTDDYLKTIPVVILTTSEFERGHHKELPARGELLPQQACGAGGVRDPHQKHQ